MSRTIAAAAEEDLSIAIINTIWQNTYIMNNYTKKWYIKHENPEIFQNNTEMTI